jgi:hypothetical protein
VGILRIIKTPLLISGYITFPFNNFNGFLGNLINAGLPSLKQKACDRRGKQISFEKRHTNSGRSSLDEVYHPLWAAIPNNPTPRASTHTTNNQPNWCKTISAISFPAKFRPIICRRTKTLYATPMKTQSCKHLLRWASSFSLAVTGEIHVCFFSSAY